MTQGNTDETPRLTHQIAGEAYTPERLPDFDVYAAVIDTTARTLDSEVPA